MIDFGKGVPHFIEAVKKLLPESGILLVNSNCAETAIVRAALYDWARQIFVGR
jgi:hypothetical protein